MSVRDEESKVHPIYETAGWVGAALLLLAYGLAVTQAVPVTDARSLVMNALGSLGIIVISARKQTCSRSW